ncbi:MAG TPA: DUF4440 domain-containing protein [Gemmatimonadales bacterium]|nr:DUF4440 domain-containing protein [Gemmatimonadales bacterium]
MRADGRTLALGLALAASAGCASARGADPAAERAGLLAADRAHAAATAAQGYLPGFVGVLADDAVYLQPGVPYLRGRGAIEAYLGGLVGVKQSSRPAKAVVAPDGRVGYTIGWLELETPDGRRYGKYIAFWRKQPDGRWRVEAWNGSAAAAAPTDSSPVFPERAQERPAAAAPPDSVGRHALFAADSAFSGRSVAEGRAAAFAAFAAPHALVLGGGPDFVIGRARIRADAAGGAAEGELLRWVPKLGGIGPSGDLGWTVGEYVYEAGGQQSHGKYLTVWERAPSGEWLYVADGGSGDPGPAQ